MSARRAGGAARWVMLLAGLALVALPGRAAAADDAAISHAESTGEQIRVLVEVPADAQVDLGAVSASLDGATLDATASRTDSGTVVERTAVLAIDISNSMDRQGRFAAAKDAARAYLETVPDDVAVGIVTFHNEVTTVLAPTTDREAARAVVNDLALERQTLLYDGVLAAIEESGSDGQRSLLVLSDGGDTGQETTLADVTAAIAESDTLVDVVALDQRGDALAALREIAAAGNGEVVGADGSTLRETFEAEAEVLAHQVLVTAPLPDGFDATEGTISITLPTDAGEFEARAFVPIQPVSGGEPEALADPTGSTGWSTPGWLLYAGIAVFAVGAFGLALMLVPARQQPMTIAERVSAYVTTEPAAQAPAKQPSEPVLDQARAAAEDLLHRNQQVEAKLEHRLNSAGSGFKPSEWLMLHVTIVLGAGLVGLLVGGGSIWFGLLFLLVGFAVPPMWLRWQAGRRRKAFNAALPETLQLMSGALSAGLSLAQAVDTIVREGPEPVAGEFKRVLVETRIGLGLEDAFEGVATRFDSRDFAWVVMAIRIQRQVGGNLAELLTTVAETMRERQYLRRQVQTLAAEGKLSAIILCALPVLFAVFLSLTNPGYLAPMFEQTLGWLMIIGATVWLALGVFWMSRLVKVEI